ncbi:hypothetical protein Avbf_18140, partial [Armadillidium vulgare]
MKFILGVLLLSVVANAQENVVPIICPVPGNPDPTTVTEDQCNTYTACEYTSGVCHMKQNNESGYLLASEPVVSTTGIQLKLKKANTENTLFGADIEQLTVDILYHQNYHFQIKIFSLVITLNKKNLYPYSTDPVDFSYIKIKGSQRQLCVISKAGSVPGVSG